MLVSEKYVSIRTSNTNSVRHSIFGFYSERLPVSWCSRWVQLPNDVTQKIDKTLNSTQIYNTIARNQQWFSRHQEKPQKVRNIWVCCHYVAHSKEASKNNCNLWPNDVERSLDFDFDKSIRSSSKYFTDWLAIQQKTKQIFIEIQLV